MKKRIFAVLLSICIFAGVVDSNEKLYATEFPENFAESTEAIDAISTTVDSTEQEDVADAEEMAATEAEEVRFSESGKSSEAQIMEATEAVESTETSETELMEGPKEMVFPTGLIQAEVLEAGEIQAGEVFLEEEAVRQDFLRSAVYASQWDSYSNNYVYNFLSDDERAYWDKLDAMCLRLLLGTENVIGDAGKKHTEFISYGNLPEREAKILTNLFRYSNPQYYFLNPYIWTSYRGTERYIGLGVYTAFADGTARQTATQRVKAQIDAWVVIANQYSTEAEKVKVLHDLIVNKVDYNYDIYNSSFNDDTAYTQSAYSVFCMDRTVCAGYSHAFEIMCNAVGVDCIAVTSSDHEWNKVRINDSWYNVDCTWDDQSSVIYYTYFERSDAYYDSDTAKNVASHTENNFWTEYLPACTLDSGAAYRDFGTLPTITQATEEPIITVMADGSGYSVSLESATPGSIIYYTLDGAVPTPSYTKSYKYDSDFTVSGTSTIKAVAVRDTYWDSGVATKMASLDTAVAPYQLSFDGNGATAGSVSSILFTAGKNITLPGGSAYQRAGYTFTGWNTAANGTGTFYTAGQRITAPWTSNVILYPQWVSNTGSSVLTGKSRFVALLYENVLGRTAAKSEIDSWVQQLEGGRTGTQVAYGFLFSDEFKNRNYNDSDYVEHLYLSLMGRPSDSGGKENWLTCLHNGISRTCVFKQFVDSAEFSQLCRTYGIIKGTITLTEARDQNYNVTRFVARNYTQFLGRGYDVDGLNHWCEVINNRKQTMQQVAYGFVFSPECKNKNLSNPAYTAMLYRGCFDHEGDAAGMANWTTFLNTSTLTREEVFYGFANSQEFANMVRSYGL